MTTLQETFSNWYNSLPYGEPSYQETFEAGMRAALAQPVAQPLELSDAEIDAVWPAPPGTNSMLTFARAILAAVNKKAGL